MEMTRDFVSAAFIVNDNKVLLVKHKKLGLWLPPGGHIDKNETPEQATIREIKEETGLDIHLEPEKFHRIKILKPHHIEIHPISENHEHISFVYFAELKGGELNKSARELEDIKWFSEKELNSNELEPEIRHFAKKAIAHFKREGGN